MVDRSKGTVKPLPQANPPKPAIPNPTAVPGQDPGASGNPYTLQYAGYGYTTPGGYSPGIVTGSPADWFGPLNPMAPTAPPEVAGRQFDFPSGYNLNIEPRAYEPIKFADLRALAESYDVLRTIIETRKDQVVRLTWNIKPRQDANGKNLTKPNDPVLTEIRDFFTMPDGDQFWDAWLREILEDLFVLDAPTLYVRRNRAGKMIGLDPIDGSTVKRIIDNHGRTPQAPLPAYQQDLHGMPAVNYTTNDLIYRPRNTRAHKVYGYSPVEQIVMTVNIALRRQMYLLQYYTEGNVPEALIGAPENWSMNQIKDFQNWFDSVLAGETGTRRRARFIPGGAKNVMNTKEGALTNETEEWLARVCCFAFSVSPTPFIKQVSRANADSQKEQAQEEGLAPIQMWIKSLINYIIWKEWKRRDVEFTWELPDDVDAGKQATIITDYVKVGIYSVNMALDKLGEDPINGGDQHLALLPTGWVPIAPTNQFGAAGGAQGAGEVHDDVKAQGTTRQSTGKDPKDVPPPTPKPKDKPAANSKGVGKVASVPFGIGLKKSFNPKLISVKVERPSLVASRDQIENALHDVFLKVGSKAAYHVKQSLHRLGKASMFEVSSARSIAESVDLSGFSQIPAGIQGGLVDIAQSSANEVLSNFPEGDVSVSDAAAAVESQATARAAELVGMQYNAQGELVANATADISIDGTTVNMIERAIIQGIEEGLTVDAVSGGIESTVFGGARAALIAGAEATRANSLGLSIAAQLLGSVGYTSRKSWITENDSKVCADICQLNEMDGWISIDEHFTSGDLMTPGHPKCRCGLSLQIG